MSKLIYLNLFIDNDWDDKKIVDQIYSLKIDSSENILKSYTHFGVFLGNESDTALVDSPFDPVFHAYLELKLGKLAKAKELESFDFHGFKKNDPIVVGVSKREEKIFGKEFLSSKGWMSTQKFSLINRKDFLFQLAGKINFPFPKSELVKFNELKADSNYVVKILNSAGGRGVFKVSEENQLLSFLERQLEEEVQDLIVLKQELVDIKRHYYTAGHTENEWLPVGFLVDYDEHGNSKKHILEKKLNPGRRDLALHIGRALRQEGYHGSFGFDGFYSQEGKHFPAVDLNVRLDKSSLFNTILKRVDTDEKDVMFYRERFTTKAWRNFQEFYENCLKKQEVLSRNFNNQFQMVVVLCSNLFHPKKEEVMAELTFMVLKDSESSESDFNQWLSESYALLGINQNASHE